MEQELKLQKGVDDGHQPWRLNPAEVANLAVKNYASSSVLFYESCIILTSNDLDSIVQCGNYKVHLTRFFGAKGIWTAVTIEITDNHKLKSGK